DSATMVINDANEIDLPSPAWMVGIGEIPPMIRICLPAIVRVIMFKLLKYLLYFPLNIFLAPSLLLEVTGQRTWFDDTDFHPLLKLQQTDNLFYASGRQLFAKLQSAD